jgi:hypothetical protein
MNHKYISLLASTLGILALYALSLFNQPIYIEIDEIGNFEGKVVTTQGIVIDYSSAKTNQLITIQQNNSSVVLFQEASIEVQLGDLVEATGTVQKYNEIWELIIDSPDSIFVLKKWTDQEIKLEDIAEHPIQYIDQNVNVTGYIDVVFDDYFHLIDEENTYTFLVKKPYIKNLTIYPGKKINMKALFTYEETQTRYLFEFRNENHTIISVLGE